MKKIDMVKKVLSDKLSIDIGNIDDDLSIYTCSNWDSMAHVDIIEALEKELGVKVDDLDLIELTSFKAIVDKFDS